VDVPRLFVDRVPVHFARSFNLVGVEEVNGTVQVATCAPYELHPIDDLATMLGKEVDVVLAPKAEITSLINRAYKTKADVVDEAISNLEDDDNLITLDGTEIVEGEDLLDTGNKAPLIKLVNMILFQALKMRASDVHVQPYVDRLQVRYRIDGVLYDMESPPKKYQDAITSRIKVMGKMDIAERRLPQDGRATLRSASRTWTCASAASRPPTASASSCACSTRARASTSSRRSASTRPTRTSCAST
jgi:general secretion pathway protein E